MSHPTPEISDKEPQFMRAAGKLPHPLTNDYMFKALLQKNKNVLEHLICSLLHLTPDEVESIEVRNPIILGKSLTEDFDSKIFVLDLNVLLNNQVTINLEIQVMDYKNWPERSLTYLCRNFDQLSSGEDYMDVKSTIHIGFLNFTLFPEYPEFYATYKMINMKNHHIFTDKFTLSVVNLKHIDLATDEDQKWNIHYWASLFKATTWEELKMLAKQNPILENAVETIYELTADEFIREQCKAREKHIREMNTILREREMAIRARDKAVQGLNEAVQKRDEAVMQLDEAVMERNEAVLERNEAVLERNEAVLERDEAVLKRDEAIMQLEQQNRVIEQLLQENNRLKKQQVSHSTP